MIDSICLFLTLVGQAEGMAPYIVSCEWLQQKISRNAMSNIVIVDVSWDGEKDCQEEYKR